jgi:hypothetical protein
MWKKTSHERIAPGLWFTIETPSYLHLRDYVMEIDDTLKRIFELNHKKLDSGCWEWCGYHSKDYGYACFYYKHRMVMVHRLGYGIETKVSDLKDVPKVLKHSCGNRGCVNPSHLYKAIKGATKHKVSGKDRYEVERLRVQKAFDEYLKAVKAGEED